MVNAQGPSALIPKPKRRDRQGICEVETPAGNSVGQRYVRRTPTCDVEDGKQTAPARHGQQKKGAGDSNSLHRFPPLRLHIEPSRSEKSIEVVKAGMGAFISPECNRGIA